MGKGGGKTLPTHSDHDEHAGHATSTFRDRFWVSLALSVPVVLAPVGIVLSPAVGAVLMSLSTVIVALNAQTLRRLGLRPSQA